MTKLFKNSKSILSLVLAFAVLAVSLFTGVVIHSHAAAADEGTIDLLEFGDYLINDLGSTSKYYDNKLDDNGETGADWDNAIIIDSAEEMVYLCKASSDNTKGKYYKVADGIAGFDFTNGDIDLDGTLADNYDKISSSGKNHAGDPPGFQGHFDGNGATVYGATVNAAPAYIGLFSQTKGDVTIKNIHVNKANFIATAAAGGIVGYHKADSMCTLTIENCSVTDSHIETTGTGWGTGVGAILGFGASAPSYKETEETGDVNGNGTIGDNIYVNVAYNIKNCYVNLDEANFVSKGEDGVEDSGERVLHGGVVGVAGSNAVMVSDCVVIGITPYSTTECTTQNDVQHTGHANNFSNVYTDQLVGDSVNVGGTVGATQNLTTVMTQLTTDQLKGAAAVENMDLDWSVWMADANGYPELANAHKNVTLVDKKDGTHAATCACGFGGIAVDCTYVDGTCACGAELNCATRKTIYWDGTIATGIATGTGRKDDPYIIKTAAEFAWLTKNTKDKAAADGNCLTSGKYYKIDDAIGEIVLQPESKAEAIMNLADSAAVKAYFESEAGLVEWTELGWEGSCFAGDFDGNGVTIYGLYSVSANNAGLFSTADAGAAFHNIALKNSYLKSEAPTADYQVGGIVAASSGATYGTKTTGAIWFDGCVVANNYMYNQSNSEKSPHDRNGVIIGASSDVVYIDNCLVYGNDAKYCVLTAGVPGDDMVMGIWSSASNGALVSDSFVSPEGLELVNDGAETPRYYNIVRNSIIFGAKPYDVAQGVGSRFNDPNCYVNVLTDSDVATDTFGGTDKVLGAKDEQIKTVTLADLATAELGDAWITTDTYPELKAFHDAELEVVPAEDAYAGHTAACSCGLSTGVAKHNYTVTGEGMEAEYKCTDCGFVCDHGNDSYITMTPIDGDCVTATGIHGKCACGFEADVPTDEAPGHDFEDKAEEPSDCKTNGVAAHKYCKVCKKNYAADADKYAAFDTALTDEDLKLELGDHVQAVDKDGVAVYVVTEAGHQKVCGVCDKTYGDVESHIGAPVANGAEGHKITCTVEGCGYAADNAPHNFGDDNKCDTCEWECTAHNYVDGETIELTFDQKYGENSELYKDICYYVEQICTICGQKGENKVIDHTVGEWETKPYVDYQPACAGDGYHTEVRVCTECYIEVDSKTVTDPKTGHSFEDVDAVEGTCMSTGTIAHKYCNACGNYFAADAADDEAYENALNPFDGSMDTPIDPENHNWVEFGSEADCDNDGVVAHKYCTECDELVVGEETVDVEVDWDEYYKYDDEGNPVGPGAIVSSNYNKYENAAITDFIAENYADSGIEVPEYPEDDSDLEAMKAYFEAYDPIFYELSQIDENFSDAWGEYWLEYWATVQFEARYEYVTAAAEEAGVDFVAPAKGHTLVKVDEVAATYDKEGTKAHYACECGKLYSDAEGKNEVTAESLVIAKLVKEDKPAGDGSTTSPVTGESVASVAAVAALVGAAFVLVRKSKKA